MNVKKEIFQLVLMLIAIVCVGTAGYVLIEKWVLTDALFMTVITMSTVGYGAVGTLSEPGKIFTIFLNIGGISLYSFAFFRIVSIVSTGSIQKMFRRDKMDKRIKNLVDHYIVCGSSEIVKYIANELCEVGKDFVIVENSEEKIKDRGLEEYLYLVGECDEEEILDRAGIEKACGIFCLMNDDRENILLVLTARSMNKGIKIITRCVNEAVDSKFRKAGADRVVFADKIGGLRMVSEMIRPNVVTFLDKMLRDPGGTRFEEIEIEEGSSLAGQSLDSCASRGHFKITVVAVMNKAGEYEYNYLGQSERVIKSGEYIVVIGDSEEINKFRTYATP